MVIFLPIIIPNQKFKLFLVVAILSNLIRINRLPRAKPILLFKIVLFWIVYAILYLLNNFYCI